MNDRRFILFKILKEKVHIFLKNYYPNNNVFYKILKFDNVPDNKNIINKINIKKTI
jgi:hypothetical protein